MLPKNKFAVAALVVLSVSCRSRQTDNPSERSEVDPDKTEETDTSPTNPANQNASTEETQIENFTLNGFWTSTCRQIASGSPGSLYQKEELFFVGDDTVEVREEEFSDSLCEVFVNRERRVKTYIAKDNKIDFIMTEYQISLHDPDIIDFYNSQSAYGHDDWAEDEFKDILTVDFSNNPIDQSVFNTFHTYSFENETFCLSIEDVNGNDGYTEEKRADKLAEGLACFTKQ